MREVDARAVSLGLPVYIMMENAGNALAEFIRQGLGDLEKKAVTVVCGLSNNGGGGFASARHLAYYGAKVTIVLLGRPSDILTEDAKLQWKTIERINSISKIYVSRKMEIEQIKKVITDTDGIIDAIFGTGYSGKKIDEPESTAIDFINSSRAYVVSNDIPSGIDADTGITPDKSVLPDMTIILHRMKVGMTNVKNSNVVSIGIPPDAEK
jgi:hydroxyethylthiazole kinase-like uncharacterized protein yjeF